MSKKSLAVVAVALGLGSQAAMAQYPQLTPEGKAKIDSLTKVWTAHSDSAWAVAFPIVKKEAMENGRPYVPWAWRPYDLKQAKIPAVPGAEGGGMYTQGGRGGKVLVVTNLNDSGPGSFRWACEQGGARIIVFNVSGIIKLETPIILRAPYVTIAGQTAPGDGVCIAGQSFQVNTHDVIVRHMRFRRGATNVWYREDSFGGNPVGNIMIDHCSCEWGLDENISFYRHMFDMGDGKPARKEPTVNVTIQNTISAKGLDTYNHAFGSTIGGENTTFMRNLWADNTGRNPSIGWGGVFNFVNNVIYNWVHRTADGGEFSTMSNFINNYYKPGPLTPKDQPVGYRIVKSESRSQKLFPYAQYGRVFAQGNIMEGNERVTKDNWDGGIQTSDKDGKLNPDELALMKSNEPLSSVPTTMPTWFTDEDWALPPKNTRSPGIQSPSVTDSPAVYWSRDVRGIAIPKRLNTKPVNPEQSKYRSVVPPYPYGVPIYRTANSMSESARTGLSLSAVAISGLTLSPAIVSSSSPDTAVVKGNGRYWIACFTRPLPDVEPESL